MYPYGPAQDFLITARLHALRHEAAEARLRTSAAPAQTTEMTADARIG